LLSLGYKNDRNMIIYYRYPINTKRSIFMFHEGSQTVDAKNYLLEQPELSHLTLEGQTYYRDAEEVISEMKSNVICDIKTQ